MLRGGGGDLCGQHGCCRKKGRSAAYRSDWWNSFEREIWIDSGTRHTRRHIGVGRRNGPCVSLLLFSAVARSRKYRHSRPTRAKREKQRRTSARQPTKIDIRYLPTHAAMHTIHISYCTRRPKPFRPRHSTICMFPACPSSPRTAVNH